MKLNTNKFDSEFTCKLFVLYMKMKIAKKTLLTVLGSTKANKHRIIKM